MEGNRNVVINGIIYYSYRCFGLGLGPRACRRLLQGVAKLTGGSTEYLDDEERLQPKVGRTPLPPSGENKNCSTKNMRLIEI